MYSEDEAIGHWRYDNGVDGLVRTGDDFGLVGRMNRAVGEEGILEVGPRFDPPLRIKRDGDASWEAVDFDAGTGSASVQRRALGRVVQSLERCEPSILDAREALAATEIVFGVWESARRCGRVDFPLEIEGNPLADMIESGE